MNTRQAKLFATAASIALLSPCPTASADINTGLAAHYTFDNCKATDTSGNKNHGTINGTLACIKGMEEKALQFDGASYISIPNSSSLNPTKEWTMAFWIRIDDVSTLWSGIIHKGGPFESGCYSNREYGVWINQDLYFEQDATGSGECLSYYSTHAIAKAKWLHYVGVVDFNKQIAKTYFNGKLDSQKALTQNVFKNNNYELRIGNTSEAYSYYSPFKGALDDVRFYNRALTDQEILALYKKVQPLGGTANGLQSYTVTCTNTTTGISKTIPLTDGLKNWSCKAAGLKTTEGDIIDIHLNGVSW
jgi:hypothetical protein